MKHSTLLPDHCSFLELSQVASVPIRLFYDLIFIKKTKKYYETLFAVEQSMSPFQSREAMMGISLSSQFF
jgi:hypothetical protein